ncbi:hypothetical protein [Prauserella cavernicola]|uniref:Uncharacterized protein n=1 Tax=Prauserella cavernicola TaxID=2800127 RepID=A0A934QS73_9PSEU|nr:hypothetical protein [Prauserella cavernicola]MBK1787267.1 hypothetical protein [Prauserella cavernicola]
MGRGYARTARRWSLYGLLAGWAGLTVFQQLDRSHWLQWKVDPTAMGIPNWRFFAPTPGRHDFNLLYRDKLADGGLGEWREHSIGVDRKALHMVWHPGRRVEKALFDAITQLFQMSEDLEDQRRVQLTVPYLALLNFVSNEIDHADDAVEVQFMIGQSAAHEASVDPKLLFLSEWHRLDGAVEPAPLPLAG